MKKLLNAMTGTSRYLVILSLIAMQNWSCKKVETAQPSAQSITASAEDDAVITAVFKQVNIVANKTSYEAIRLDPKLQNAWGLSADDEGEIWVSSNETGLSFVYGPTGRHLMTPVAIPSHDQSVPGNPTGNIYNNTDDFIIPGTGTKAEFIFADEHGTISAWNDPTGSTAVIVADRTGADPVYKGLTIARDGGENFIYVTNFGQNKIDVFDKDFNYVDNKPFTDPGLPAGFAPFNIRNIEGMLFVTYALQKEDGEDDSAGTGNGYVDIYRPNGQLVKRFASNGTLNSPWGITEASPGASAETKIILIGNFGDGRINIYSMNGNYKGQMMSDSGPVSIDGLWAIDTQIPGIKPGQLYFTAGPEDESDGLFGMLMKQ